MKLLLGTGIAFMIIGFIIVIIGTLQLDNKLQNSREQNSQLRRERNMYDSLYRTANTRLYQFQDSINKHCICK